MRPSTAIAVVFALSASACYREARVVSREHIDDGSDKVSYVVRDAPPPGQRVVVHRDRTVATREAVTQEGERVLIRTDPLSGQTTIVSPDRHTGQVVVVRPEAREGIPVVVLPDAPRERVVVQGGSGGDDVMVRAPRAAQSESLLLWSRQNPEAAEAMCLFADRYPEAAGKYFEWEALHPDRAREVMAWAVEHRDGGVGLLVDSKPAAADLFWQDRAAASAYLDWIRRYPRAAEALLDHPRALSAAGARQTCR